MKKFLFFAIVACSILLCSCKSSHAACDAYGDVDAVDTLNTKA